MKPIVILGILMILFGLFYGFRAVVAHNAAVALLMGGVLADGIWLTMPELLKRKDND